MWEATVLDAIIRGALDPPGGEWDAEAVVTALRAIRSDRARVEAVESASPSAVLETFLEVYRGDTV